jgi:hypothetical protein
MNRKQTKKKKSNSTKRPVADKKTRVLAKMPGLIITGMSDKAPSQPVIKEQTKTPDPEPAITASTPPVVDNETRQKYGDIAGEVYRLAKPQNNLQRFRERVKEFVSYFKTKRRESVIRLLKQYQINELTYPPESDNIMDNTDFPDCIWDTETWYVQDILEDHSFVCGIWREKDCLDDIQAAPKFGSLPIDPSNEERLLLAYTCLCSLHDFIFSLAGLGSSILPGGQFEGFENGYELGWVYAVRRYYCEYGRNPLLALRIFLDDVRKDLAEVNKEIEPPAQTGESLPTEGTRPVQPKPPCPSGTANATGTDEDENDSAEGVKDAESPIQAGESLHTERTGQAVHPNLIAPIEANKGERGIAKTDTREVLWTDNDPNYITNSEAVKLAGGDWTVKKLGKLLTPQGLIRYMRRGRRGKVNKTDFNEYLRQVSSPHPSQFPDQAIESYLQGVEERRDEIRRAKKSGE